MHLFSGKRPNDLGLDASGRLSPCPDKPNCVCSQTEDKKHNIMPIQFSGNPDTAMDELKKTLLKIKGIRIVIVTQDYLYAECKSALMGFIDDLEFSLHADINTWHVRSASRLGSYDFGMNRRRVESIRHLLNHDQGC